MRLLLVLALLALMPLACSVPAPTPTPTPRHTGVEAIAKVQEYLASQPCPRGVGYIWGAMYNSGVWLVSREKDGVTLNWRVYDADARVEQLQGAC